MTKQELNALKLRFAVWCQSLFCQFFKAWPLGWRTCGQACLRAAVSRYLCWCLVPPGQVSWSCWRQSWAPALCSRQRGCISLSRLASPALRWSGWSEGRWGPRWAWRSPRLRRISWNSLLWLLGDILPVVNHKLPFRSINAICCENLKKIELRSGSKSVKIHKGISKSKRRGLNTSPLFTSPLNSSPIFTSPLFTSPAHYFPSSILPLLNTSPPLYFPSSIVPLLNTSPPLYFPSSIVPLLNTSPPQYFPSSILPLFPTYLKNISLCFKQQCNFDLLYNQNLENLKSLCWMAKKCIIFSV